jgi:methyltransferase (TIGR00027 family)
MSESRPGTADPATSDLAATAHWTAAVRAAETARDDHLFEDPWADALAAEVGRAWISERTPDSYAPIAIRTRYFDEWLGRATTAGISQVVLGAAGLDTRAFRLAWPAGTALFEVDREDVLAFKGGVLAAAGARPACERRVVVADMTARFGEALRAAGFDPAQPTAWLLEGFLFYLPATAIDSILVEVSGLAAPASRLAFDIINGETLTSPYTRAWLAMQAAAGAPWIGSMEDPATTLGGLGWDAHLTQGGRPDAEYGRWPLPVYPTDAPGLPHSWLVTAERG